MPEKETRETGQSLHKQAEARRVPESKDKKGTHSASQEVKSPKVRGHGWHQ